LKDTKKSNPRALEFYTNESKYQKGLEEFINKNLSQYVYKRQAVVQESPPEAGDV
jgi:hypothetical protein